MLDPDREVQGAVRLVFTVFRETGSAYAVVQRFVQQGLTFPKRAYGGAWDGKVIWGRLTHSRVLGVLKNPSYAGVYVFGRYQSHKQISADGQVRTKTKPVPMDSWRVKIEDHHDGYISYKQFDSNQVLLQKNRTNAEAMVLSGPAREGLALLQGLLLCWRCGRRLSVRYRGNGGIYPTYDCNWRRREGLSTKSCMNIRCDLLDAAISDRVLAVLAPAQLELATEAVLQLEKRDAALSSQWQMRLERAEYEAQLAERRYEEVDPANRLVAATLETRWNDALVKLEELKAQLAEFQRKEACVVTDEQRQEVLALAKDFPHLWNAPSTRDKDKKRMLRLLIKDITVERDAERRVVILHVRWQGGACEVIQVALPPTAADKVRYPEAFVQKVRQLAVNLSDDEIAETLNRDGLRPAKGESFNVSIVSWIRYKHQIPSPQRRRSGELTVKEVAGKLGVSPYVVYYWINRGIIEGRRRKKGTPYWITLDDQKEAELRERIRNSVRIQKQRRNS